jgi:hypothetical protein
MAVSLFVMSLGSNLFAQGADSFGQNPSPTQPGANGALQWPEGGKQGGGGLADFNELINLIHTIVPANWDQDGGEDTVQPSANGVWIDVNGKLARGKSSKLDGARLDLKSTAAITELPMLGSVQTKETIRWISLNEVEANVRDAMKSNSIASPNMLMLGGITRIDHVAYEPNSRSWYLGGPAGELVLDKHGNLIGRSTGLPPVVLEDLLALAPLVLNGKGPIGCSIDPVPERLKAVSELIVSPIAKRSLVQQASKWSTKLAETLGDQKATVFGLSNDSPTALALLIADEHMKRIGLGLDIGPASLMSYWEESEKRGKIPASALIRWWFALRDDITIGASSDGNVFAIESPTVRVMSQGQWMDATGQRYDVNESDPSADAFARGFTDRFADLQEMYPAIYGRLRHIFDLSVALKLIREESIAKKLAKPEVLTDTQVQPHMETAIQWIPSIAAWRKTSSGRVAAIVSGGVNIEVQKAKPTMQNKNGQPKVDKPFALK